MTKSYTSPSAIPWDQSKVDMTSTDWQKKWPEMNVKGTDPVEVVADLYLPEGIACHGFVHGFTEPTPTKALAGPRILELGKILRLSDAEIAEYSSTKVATLGSSDPLAKMAAIAIEAKEYQSKLVERVTPTFWAYAHAACGGELRHHPSIAGHKLNGVRKGAWVGWRDIFETYGPESLKLMSKLFLEIPGASIGGKRWAAASDILYQYEMGKLGKTPESNKKIFLDRVLALQHNGGCFLSKRTWANHRKGRTEKVNDSHYKAESLGTSGQGMVPILDCHAANPPNINGLYSCASEKVREMAREYFKAAEEAGLTTVSPFEPKKSPVSKVVSAPPPPPVVSTKKDDKNKFYDILAQGDFEVQIKITKLLDAGGTQHGGGLVAQIPKKIYKFKTKDDFDKKTFYFAHMLKGSQFPQASAQTVMIRIVKGTYKSPYAIWDTPYSLSKVHASGVRSKIAMKIDEGDA